MPGYHACSLLFLCSEYIFCYTGFSGSKCLGIVDVKLALTVVVVILMNVILVFVMQSDVRIDLRLH